MRVGSIEGDSVGPIVGDIVGLLVGFMEGRLVTLAEGVVGTIVGFKEGRCVVAEIWTDAELFETNFEASLYSIPITYTVDRECKNNNNFIMRPEF